MKKGQIFHSPAPGLGRFVTAPAEISALELLPTQTGAHSGRLTAIPKNACLQVCGNGFNERTIKVRWNNSLCYVFLRDVEPEEMMIQ